MVSLYSRSKRRGDKIVISVYDLPQESYAQVMAKLLSLNHGSFCLSNKERDLRITQYSAIPGALRIDETEEEYVHGINHPQEVDGLVRIVNGSFSGSHGSQIWAKSRARLIKEFLDLRKIEYLVGRVEMECSDSVSMVTPIRMRRWGRRWSGRWSAAS